MKRPVYQDIFALEYQEQQEYDIEAMPQTTKCAHCGKGYNVRLSICPFCGGERVFDEGERVVPSAPAGGRGLYPLRTLP